MQAQMNPALAAALTLQQAAQQGQFSPTTPSGQPTVVEQLMQQMSPPAVQDVAQQAALGGQIQAMQQQQAAQQAQNPQAVAQMVAQMLQSRQAPGIEGLNPNIQGFAEGGIVGYSQGDKIKDSDSAEKEQRIFNAEEGMFVPPPMQEIPIPEITVERQKLPPEVSEAFSAARSRIAEESAEPASVEEISAYEKNVRNAQRQMMIERGIDPDLLQNQEKEAVRRGQERIAYANKLASELEGRQSPIGGIPRAFADFLLNAEGFKGQGAGKIFRTGVAGMERAESGAREESRKINELRFAYEDALTKERQSLSLAQRATALGDWSKATDAINEAKRQKQRQNIALAGIDQAEAKVLGNIVSTQIRAEATEYAADVRRELGLARPGASGREPIVRRVDEDVNGNKIAIMSDGSQKPLGYKSVEYENRVGRMQQQLLKDGPPGYRKLPFEAQRQIAMEYVVGKSSAPPAATSSAAPASGSAAPGSALPSEALSQLKEGEVVRFGNGQEWTLQNGQPKRVK